MTAMTETRAKYTADELKAMLAKGHAIKNASGDPSYPIADEEDLHNAIHAVGRGGSDHDAIRRHIISRAKALGLSSAIPDGWNADGSLGGSTAARTPLEVLRRRRGSMIRKQERRGMLLEMRAKSNGAGGTDFVFEGYGSTFDQPFEMWDQWGDPYTEVVRPGAFTRSLGRPDLDVPFLIGHNDAGIPLARTRNGTMRLSQDTRGLHVSATMDGGRSDVRNLASAVERGDLDEMSIGFVTEEQRWSDDYMTREMLGLNLHRGDVSAVALAANPSTAGATMFAMPGEAASAWRPGEARAASHPPFTGTHSHAHPAYGDGGQHEHEHEHQGDANHDHHAVTTDDPDSDGLTPTLSANAAALSSGRPLEQLARGEVADSDSHPDFNVAAGPVSNGVTAVKCPYEGRNGCGVMNPGGNRFCGNCGGPLYDGDGLMVLDDAGVVEEVAGAQGDANLLSLRLRLLELA